MYGHVRYRGRPFPKLMRQIMPMTSVVIVKIRAAVVIRLKNNQVAYVQRKVAAMNIVAQPTSTNTATPRNIIIRFLYS